MHQLHPKAVWLFFSNFLIIFLIIGGWIGAILGLTFIPLFFKDIAAIGAALIALLLFLVLTFAIIAYVWAKLAWENYMYKLTDESLEIHRGVLWKVHSSIPYERIQNVDIVRGIIARIVGLSDLQIHTAGYSGAARVSVSEGRLPGLVPEKAEELRKLLIKKVKGVKQGL